METTGSGPHASADRESAERTDAESQVPTVITDADQQVASQIESLKKSDPLDVPGELGRYRILKRIGQGGMGTVYLAEDTTLDRQVALKVPRFSVDEAPDALKRFHREARAAAKISHPNICPVYDVGEIAGVHYLSMAYLQGEPLSALMPKVSKLPLARIALIAFKIAESLDQAHRRAIVHRDLKPSNIMMTSGGEPVIMDFGLARRVDVADDRLTKTGVVLGTPVYMSPEQMRGSTVSPGPECDIYSLGVILYEMLTGRVPFEGSLAETLYQAALADPVPPAQYREDLDPQLQGICLKAMNKAPQQRFSSMAEMAGALAKYIRERERPKSAAGNAGQVGEPDSDSASVPDGSLRAEAASLLIDRRRDELLALAEQQTRQGLPERATKTLRTASQLCPDDQHISELLNESENRAKLVALLVKKKIPELEKANRYDELLRCLQELKQLRVNVKGLDALTSRVAKKLEAVQEAVEFAKRRLEAHHYDAALAAAERVLQRVADHPEARQIAESARRAMGTLEQVAPDLTKAVADRRWRRAQAIWSELERKGIEDEQFVDLVQSIQEGMTRLNNYARLLLWTISGWLVWLFSGYLAQLFAAGIQSASGEEPLFGWAVLGGDFIATNIPLAAQLGVAGVLLGGARLVLIRRVSNRWGVGVLFFAGVLVLLSGLIPPGLDSLSIAVPAAIDGHLTRLVALVVYGSMAATVLTMLMQGLQLEYKALPPRHGLLLGAGATIVGYGISLSSDSFATSLPSAIVVAMLLVVTGQAKLGLRLFLPVLAGVFAAGLILGIQKSGMGSSVAGLPLAVTAIALFLGSLLACQRLSWQCAGVCGVVALAVAVVCHLASGIAMAPSPAVLLTLWFAIAATFAWANRQNLQFELQLLR